MHVWLDFLYAMSGLMPQVLNGCTGWSMIGPGRLLEKSITISHNGAKSPLHSVINGSARFTRYCLSKTKESPAPHRSVIANGAIIRKGTRNMPITVRERGSSTPATLILYGPQTRQESRLAARGEAFNRALARALAKFTSHSE